MRDRARRVCGERIRVSTSYGLQHRRQRGGGLEMDRRAMVQSVLHLIFVLCLTIVSETSRDDDPVRPRGNGKGLRGVNLPFDI